LLCRPGRPHGKPGGMLHCGRPLEVEHAVLRATPPVLAADGVGPPHRSGLCGSAGPAARMASRAACSTAGSALRWSTQSCVPRLQVEHAVLRATPPVLAAGGVASAVPLGIVWLCRPGRPHGKPGGMLHCGRRLEVEHAVLRATPSSGARSLACHAASLGGGWRWPPVPLGIVWLCRPGRPHGKPGGMLHGGLDWVKGRAVGKGRPSRLEGRPPKGAAAVGSLWARRTERLKA